MTHRTVQLLSSTILLTISLLFTSALLPAAMAKAAVKKQAPKAAVQNKNAAPVETSKKNEVVVEIKNSVFPNVTASVGSTVTFVNKDDFPHGVKSPDKAGPNLEELKPGEKYSWVANNKGKIKYYCSPYAQAPSVGTITVK